MSSRGFSVEYCERRCVSRAPRVRSAKWRTTTGMPELTPSSFLRVRLDQASSEKDPKGISQSSADGAGEWVLERCRDVAAGQRVSLVS